MAPAPKAAGGVVVAILAGGASRRMGSDKAFVEVGGVAMIRRVIAAAAGCEPIVIAPRTPPYLALGVPVYEDRLPGMGPLSGLHAAFAVTAADRVVLVACDLPLVRPELIRWLVGRDDWEGDALIPTVGGYEQGLLAVYRRAGVERVEAAMRRGGVQFDTFRRGLKVATVGEREVSAVDADLRSFLNMNRPEDIEKIALFLKNSRR
jgi:molybdopterin-guanine dinucleotide biosynthesis protein A